MRPLFGIAAAAGLCVSTAVAQDPVEQRKAAIKMDLDQMLRGAKVVGVEAGIMGPMVKGAPYSADEIHETNQVLADGTRIHNETKTTIYRDGQGRVRRESPGQVMIWDGTTGTSFMLNESNQTAHKMQMAVNYSYRRTAGADAPPPEPLQFRTFHFQNGGEGAAGGQIMVLKTDEAPGTVARAESKVKLGVLKADGVAAQAMPAAKKETLDKQIMEGLSCEGVRYTTTLDTGAIGNDRPIQTVEERWYSSDLQVNMLVRRTDPRSGEDIVRMTNVRRLEPDPSLFTVPAGYQVNPPPGLPVKE